MKSSNLFITGCDSNTKWMLPWFQENFYRHNPDAELMVFDFDEVYNEFDGWFKKPAAMLHAATLADKVCWLDTDCEVRGDLSPIFHKIVPNKLTMAVDRPWTKRRGDRGTWFNSGVVAFTGHPVILTEWKRYIEQGLTKEVGDQEVLNWMLGGDPLRELTHIENLPNAYNFLRLDIKDGYPGLDTARVLHWTGHKGKQHIRELMNG